MHLIYGLKPYFLFLFTALKEINKLINLHFLYICKIVLYVKKV